MRDLWIHIQNILTPVFVCYSTCNTTGQTTCCSSLKSVYFEECHSLPRLDLGNSLHLKELTLKEAESLTHLKLRGCRLLSYCYIDCPNLQHADLDGCRRAALRHCKDIQVAMGNSQ